MHWETLREDQTPIGSYDPVPSGSNSSNNNVSFIAAVVITLTMGVGLAMLAIVFLRPPAQQTCETKPKIIQLPAPPPEVIIKEVVKEVPVPEPAEPVIEIPVRQPWEGIWRPKRSELPMFKLKNAGGAVAGIHATANGAVLPFQGGKVVGDAIELAVDDNLFRLHFRLEMKNSESMSVESWITDEDWLNSLARGSQTIRTTQQELFVRKQLEENAKLTRKRVSLGFFYRGTEN